VKPGYVTLYAPARTDGWLPAPPKASSAGVPAYRVVVCRKGHCNRAYDCAVASPLRAQRGRAAGGSCCPATSRARGRRRRPPRGPGLRPSTVGQHPQAAQVPRCKTTRTEAAGTRILRRATTSCAQRITGHRPSVLPGCSRRAAHVHGSMFPRLLIHVVDTFGGYVCMC
jgi:hypothetical protein